jgi:hypothetical protein
MQMPVDDTPTHDIESRFIAHENRHGYRFEIGDDPDGLGNCELKYAEGGRDTRIHMTLDDAKAVHDILGRYIAARESQS